MIKGALIAAGTFVLAISPYFGIPGWTPALATVAASVAISLVGLNLIFGYCGMLALGQAAFAVIPAYAAGILVANGVPTLVAVVVGFAIAVLLARVLAEIFIRLPGIYLAVGTLGFAYVVEGIARAFPSVTGGASGLILTLPFVPTENQWYGLAVTSLAIATVAAFLFLKGSTARTLKLVRRDELAAEVAGVNVVALKAKVFSVGAAFSAAGGLLLAYYTSVVTPEMGGANTSLEYLAMTVIGGAGSIAGPIIGAIAVNWLFAVSGAAARYELLVYGACFLAIILFAPGGLVQLFGRLLPNRKATEAPGAIRPVASENKEYARSRAARLGLRALDVSKSFGGVHAVRNVSLDAAPGEIVAVLGPNGAGKSTFFNILSGIELSNDGVISLDEVDITKLPIYRRAVMIGRSFQVPRLVLDMTVLQNVITRVDQLFPKLDERARGAMALAELDRFKLAHLAHQPAGAVAVGLHKLIDIARAAVGNPSLVLLDEPAVGLHADELEGLKKIIFTLKESGAAVVVVDHNMTFIRAIADRILVMDGGRPIAAGKPSDVLDSAEVRAAYLGVLE